MRLRILAGVLVMATSAVACSSSVGNDDRALEAGGQDAAGAVDGTVGSGSAPDSGGEGASGQGPDAARADAHGATEASADSGGLDAAEAASAPGDAASDTDAGAANVCIFDQPASTFDGVCTFGN